MKRLRYWVPVLGILALAALFFKLPETPNVFGLLGCKTCGSNDPYLPLFGAGYFAALIAVSLLFPTFPGRLVARGGLVWAVLLASALTYMLLPGWCAACLVAHACNILIWTIWVVVLPAAREPSASTIKERLCLALFAPISVVALFSCLNLTFMAYGFKVNRNIAASSLRLGDAAPAFTAPISGGPRSFSTADAAQTAATVINFVSPDCSFCKEQLHVLNAVATQLASGPYRFINVSPMLLPELVQNAPATEWVEDKGGKLRELFKVSGYPTMFVVGTDGKIAQVIPGVPEQLKAYLLTSLVKIGDKSGH